MRGTKAKELRKADEAIAKGAVAIEIKIQVARDGRVEVQGFPNNFNQTMEIMQAGMRRVAGYFVAMAREGKVDEKFNLEQNRIVKPNGPIPILPKVH